MGEGGGLELSKGFIESTGCSENIARSLYFHSFSLWYPIETRENLAQTDYAVRVYSSMCTQLPGCG